MFEEFFRSSEEAYRKKICEARDAIRQYKGREPTEKEIDDYLFTD